MFANSTGDSASSSDRLTILAVGLKVTGDIETDGVIKVEGTVEGSIRAGGQVLVAASGVIKGDLYTNDAVIGGRVEGSLTAQGRVEIEAGALVEGDLMAPRLIVHEGGKIDGRVSMVAPEVAQAQGPVLAAG
jgi:cytoskeletal protein CcmA (bactofilin family)